MYDSPPVLLIDDGDLGEVAQLLQEMGVAFDRIDASRHRGPMPEAQRLLVTSSRLAISQQCRRGPPGQSQRAVWIAFLHGESRTQRQVLERAGFDFMVRQPVHPTALRLLLQHALYRGEESRRAGRVAFGYEVGVKLGLRTHKATLSDLSPTGCRLILGKFMAKNQKLIVRIPAEVAGGNKLDLAGVVVRSTPAQAEGGHHDHTSYGVRFNRMDRDSRDRLRDLLLDFSRGPAQLPERVTMLRPAKPAKDAARKDARAHARKQFDDKVTAIGGKGRAETHHVLLGRDISLGGMLVDREDGLDVGEEIRLAIQPAGEGNPVLVEATVVREEGDRGLALRFDWIDPEASAELCELIEALPAIETLCDAPNESGGTVLSRVLSRLRS